MSETAGRRDLVTETTAATDGLLAHEHLVPVSLHETRLRVQM